VEWGHSGYRSERNRAKKRNRAHEDPVEDEALKKEKQNCGKKKLAKRNQLFSSPKL